MGSKARMVERHRLAWSEGCAVRVSGFRRGVIALTAFATRRSRWTARLWLAVNARVARLQADPRPSCLKVDLGGGKERAM